MDDIRDAVRLYSVRSVAERLEMSRVWVYAQISAGLLRSVELGSTRVHTRVRSDDLQAFIDARTFGLGAKDLPVDGGASDD